MAEAADVLRRGLAQTGGLAQSEPVRPGATPMLPELSAKPWANFELAKRQAG
jgi:hypothetical protein